MTIMKSPGNKLKTPKKEPHTPNNGKSPKSKGPFTPKVNTKPQTPSLAKQGTPMKSKTPNQNAGTPRPKTPNVTGTPKPKTPQVNGTQHPKVAKAGGTPKPEVPKGFTPKSENRKSIKAVAQKSPIGKTPGTPGHKTPKGKSPKGGKGTQTPAQANAAATPKGKKEVKSVPVASPSRKRSASVAGLDKTKDSQIAFKAIRVYNLPTQLNSTDLLQKVKELMEPRGEIDKVTHDETKQVITVIFSKAEDARAAKKLNGHLLSGRHLTIVHHDDRDLPSDNRVVLYNVPTDLGDEDVWSIFGSCGKILAIHMNRDWRTKKVQKCFVTFDSKKGAAAALSSKKELRGKQILLKKAGQDGRLFPVENTVYLLNISTDSVEDDVQKFVGKCGPVSGVTIVESRKRYAMVHMTNTSDVEKALALSGKQLKGKEVTLERHRKSPLYVKSKPAQSVTAKKEKPSKEATKQEVPAKKLKQNNGKVLVKEDPVEDDDESNEDDSEDEDMSGDDNDLLAAFQGKMQKLKSVKVEADGEEDEDDSEEEDDEDEDDDEDDEEDDDEDGEDDDGEDDDEDDDE